MEVALLREASAVKLLDVWMHRCAKGCFLCARAANELSIFIHAKMELLFIDVCYRKQTVSLRFHSFVEPCELFFIQLLRAALLHPCILRSLCENMKVSIFSKMGYRQELRLRGSLSLPPRQQHRCTAARSQEPALVWHLLRAGEFWRICGGFAQIS